MKIILKITEIINEKETSKYSLPDDKLTANDCVYLKYAPDILWSLDQLMLNEIFGL